MNRFLIAWLVMLVALLSPSTSDAQLGFGNTVDFDVAAILNCDSLGPLPPTWQFTCTVPALLQAFVDDLTQAEEFLDELVVGYRNDMPSFVFNQLDEPLLIQCQIGNLDGPGGTLAVAGPIQNLFFLPNPFLRLRGGFRAWSLPRLSQITFDCEDVPFLVLTDTMVEVAVHEAFHAMGHPFNFDITDLNRPTNAFGQINFAGDTAGINGVGFGLTEYRAESGNPFASFIPLQQDLAAGDTPGHLSPFDPTFVRTDEMLQEAFLPAIAPPGTQGFMSFALQGMFADLGYRITGINAPGFLDIDQDGIEDPVTIINPQIPTDP